MGPLFWTSGDVSSGFQHLQTSWQATWLLSQSLPLTCEGIGGTQTGDLSLHERTLSTEFFFTITKLEEMAILIDKVASRGNKPDDY